MMQNIGLGREVPDEGKMLFEEKEEEEERRGRVVTSEKLRCKSVQGLEIMRGYFF